MAAEAVKESVLESRMKAVDEAEEQAQAYRKKIIGIVIAFVLLLGLHFSPTLPGLKPEGQSVLGIFCWFIACMVTDALPNVIVGLGAPLLVVLLTKAKIPAAFSAFASDVFFLGVGAFIFAAIMMGTPLGKRVALTIVSAMKTSRVKRILMGLGLADLAVGGVIPTVSETALFLPIAKGVGSLMAGKEHLPEVKRINVSLIILICGLVPLYSGLLILTSHFPNLILVELLHKAEGVKISWGQWFWLNLPLWGLLPIMFYFVVWWFKVGDLEIPGAETELPKMKAELGRITFPEIWALICLGLGLILWIFEPYKIQAGMTALVVAMLMFLPWSRIEMKAVGKYVLWDTLILLAGAISLGTSLHSAGAVQWLAQFVVNPLKSTGWPAIPVLLILVAGLHVARAGIVSAVAMGAMFVPMALGLAKALGYSTLPFTLIVINCLSYAFFLPMSITAFFIAWGISEESFWGIVKFGTILSIISNIYVILVQTAWLSLIGYPMTKAAGM
ncbi:MAG: SLC13 family permease [Thermodesulfobacteriota bacterium]